MLPVAVMDEFGQSGPAEELLTLYGSPQSILRRGSGNC